MKWKLIGFLIFSVSQSIPMSGFACDTKTEADHWFTGVLTEFVKAEGCAVQGGSIGSPLLQAPYFAVTKLNTKSLGPLEEPFDLKIWNPDSVARPFLEKLFAREDVMMIIAPMTDDYGIVISDPEMVGKVRSKFSFLPNLEKVKILFVLSNAADILTVVHENQHMQDVLAGRLPLSQHKLNKLIFDLKLAADSTGYPNEASQALLKSWLTALHRGLPEIAAIQAEHKFLLSRGESQLSFVEYLNQSNHDYINKHGGTAWTNESLKNDASTEMLKTSARIICAYTRDIFNDLQVADFREIFFNCQ